MNPSVINDPAALVIVAAVVNETFVNAPVVIVAAFNVPGAEVYSNPEKLVFTFAHVGATVGGVGLSNLIVKDRVIAPGETYTFPMMVGHTLNPEARISAIASLASTLVIYVSGREIT